MCAGLDQAPQENGWETIAPGAIAVIVDKNTPPACIKVRRKVFGRNLSDMWVGTDEPAFENENNQVVLVYEKMPFVRHDGVVFE